MAGYTSPIYEVITDSVLRDSTLHDPVTFANQNDLNLIIDQRIKFDREYILLDRTKIESAIADPDNLLNIFTEYELQILFKQALEAYYITEEQIILLMSDATKVYDEILMNDIHALLYSQLHFVTRVPNITDLEANGLFDSIIKVIQLNPEVLIDLNLVEQYTTNILDQKLEENVFISFEKLELILSNTNDTMQILTSTELINLLERVKSHITFVTDESIAAVQALIDSNSFLITSVYQNNEIKIILDKEIELKNLLLKSLTPEKVQEMFNTFKDDFLNSSFDTIIDAKFDTLRAELLGTNYDALIAQQVDTYLTTKYNTIMRQFIDEAFTTFKDDFINIDLLNIVTGYFDTLKAEMFDVNYNGLIEAQVISYLDTNFPTVTAITVNSWILNEINKG
jgi:hypothetical protein